MHVQTDVQKAEHFPSPMLNSDHLSGGAFVTALIAIAVALTGLVTLVLNNRRMRAERAFPIIQSVEARREGRLEIEIENVGGRAALDLVVYVNTDKRLVSGGLRSGESVVVDIPSTASLDLAFRDADGGSHLIRTCIDWSDGSPVLMERAAPSRLHALLVRAGLGRSY